MSGIEEELARWCLTFDSLVTDNVLDRHLISRLDYVHRLWLLSQQLKKDVEEFESLLKTATRLNVKEWLEHEIRKLRSELFSKQVAHEAATAAANATAASGDTSSSSQQPKQTNTVYRKQITTYGWDQSDKFLKIYVTATGVQNIPRDNVKCDFKNSAVTLVITELDNVTYEMNISNLLHPLVPNESYIKIKTDSVLVMMKKKDAGKTWPCVTESENKSKKKDVIKPPPMDTSQDPQAGLMDLLKKMYDDGDDDMKRTLMKSMYEAQSKKQDMDMLG